MDAYKIIFTGPSGVGKTTLRKIFFEQDSPIKLLKESLEPTYGVETNQYDIGKQIAIHDLAGQQINEWLNESKDVFIDADLIILIVDSRDKWEDNYELWKKVYSIKNEFCPGAYLGIFFHKIDLISSEERISLQKRLEHENATSPDIYAFITSINEEFFVKTFEDFIKFFRNFLIREKDTDLHDLFSKMLILNQFIGKSKLNLREIATLSGESEENIGNIISNLRTDGFIVFKEGMQVQLSDKGQSTMISITDRMKDSIGKTDVVEKGFIKALILSDRYGKSFLQYEKEYNFFKNLKATDEYDGDPQLIAMFFSALHDFGRTLDSDGFSEVVIQGKKLKIAIVTINYFSGIFFLNDIDLNKKTLSTLQLFMNDIFTNFSSEIDQFVRLNSISNMKDLRKRLTLQIKSLNDILESFDIFKKVIPKRDLIGLYQKLDSESLDENSIVKIKNILFQYMLNEDPKILEEIESFLSEKEIEIH